MQVTLGYNAAEDRTKQPSAVLYEPARLINGHMLVLGDSGVGKTTFLRRGIMEMVVTSMRSGSDVRVHLFDSHGDISIPHASEVTFSEASGYGLNPLEINPDPHFGGVRRAVNAFISTVNRTVHKLGVKQENCLRELLDEIYHAYGFDSEDASTWSPSRSRGRHNDAGRIYLDVPPEEAESAEMEGCIYDEHVGAFFTSSYTGRTQRWPMLSSDGPYPTVKSLVRFGQARINSLFLGANQPAMVALEVVNRQAKSRHKEIVERYRSGTRMEWVEDPDFKAKCDAAVLAYTDYIEAVRTGTELRDLLKFTSLEVLRGVVDRLKALQATGIFGSKIPPFNNDAPVWRYNISPLDDDEKRLFVDFRLHQIFAAAVQRGVVDRVMDVVIIDEAKLYITDDDQHILNRIIREARKFGVALIIASQSPGHFTNDLLTQVSTKIVLGLDRGHWPHAIRKLGLTETQLAWIRAHQRAIVLLKRAGQNSSPPIMLELPDMTNMNRRAAA